MANRAQANRFEQYIHKGRTVLPCYAEKFVIQQ